MLNKRAAGLLMATYTRVDIYEGGHGTQGTLGGDIKRCSFKGDGQIPQGSGKGIVRENVSQVWVNAREVFAHHVL